VDVGVGDLQPGYHQADLLRLETPHYGFAGRLGDGHEVRGQQGLEVKPVVHPFSGDDERVPRA